MGGNFEMPFFVKNALFVLIPGAASIFLLLPRPGTTFWIKTDNLAFTYLSFIYSSSPYFYAGCHASICLLKLI